MIVKNLIQKLCEMSGEDIFLTKQYYNKQLNKSWYDVWTKSSMWNWNKEPTDRQILKNEIVIETDYDVETNKKLTDKFQNKLKELGITYHTYFTTSKSYHIHLFVKNINDYENKYYLKSIKQEITKIITGKNYDDVDHSNFYDKKLIRIEGSIHPKTMRQTILYDKQLGQDFEITKELEQKFTKKHVIQNQDISSLTKSKKVFCQVIENAMTNKFPTGKRNSLLLPNAVAVLNCDELQKLCETQEQKYASAIGWKKKKVKFNCASLRKYARDIGKEQLCKRCVASGYFYSNNGG